MKNFQTKNTLNNFNSQIMGAKIHNQKRNNADLEIRSLSIY